MDGWTVRPRSLAVLRLTTSSKVVGERGYVEGQNVEIEYRWAEGHYDRLPAFAAEFVNRPVDLIVATGGDRASLGRPADCVPGSMGAAKGDAGDRLSQRRIGQLLCADFACLPGWVAPRKQRPRQSRSSSRPAVIQSPMDARRQPRAAGRQSHRRRLSHIRTAPQAVGTDLRHGPAGAEDRSAGEPEPPIHRPRDPRSRGSS